MHDTKFEVADNDADTVQQIHYDWSACGGDVQVNAILMETDESRMTSGEIKFYIGGVECPDTNGVGVNAIGGVFNCRLTGSTFGARCTTPCSPFLSVVELFLWKEEAMTLSGTPYYVADSHGCTNFSWDSYDGEFSYDTEKLFGTGSYWYQATDWLQVFCS